MDSADRRLRPVVSMVFVVNALTSTAWECLMASVRITLKTKARAVEIVFVADHRHSCSDQSMACSELDFVLQALIPTLRGFVVRF